MPSLRSLTKSVVYRALDVSTAGRGVKRTINAEPIRFPARWCRYYPADYERETFVFFRANCKPGDTVLDIGAHIGLFSVLSARLVGHSGKVLSFEPTPLTREVLTETVRLNDCAQIVEVFSQAISRKSGEATFYDTGIAGSNANSLVRGERSQGSLTVETISIDDLAQTRKLSVNCIKIDVEGSELDVLMGAERTLSADRPAMSLGLHPPFLSNPVGILGEIWQLLRKHKMNVSYLGHPVDEEWFCSQTDLFDVQVTPAALDS